MLIPKWYGKSKLDEKWGILLLGEIKILGKIEIETFLLSKNPQFSSNFDLLYHFGISISGFHNKILIWGQSSIQSSISASIYYEAETSKASRSGSRGLSDLKFGIQPQGHHTRAWFIQQSSAPHFSE